MTKEMLDDLLELVEAKIEATKSEHVEDTVHYNNLYFDFLRNYIYDNGEN